MIGPFLYLTACSVKNRVLGRLRRLRQPRYVAGLAAGLLYLYWFVLRNQMRTSRRGGAGFAALASLSPDFVAGGALLLWAGAVLVWIWPFTSKVWTFSGAEIQFLFTAPVTRRRLLDYKLGRSQLGLLFGVLVAALFTGAARAAAAGRWSFLLGGWLLFAAMHLHILGANLAKSSFRAPASKVPWLAWASAAAMLTVSGILVGSFAVHARVLVSRPPGDVLLGILELTRSGPAAVALWPFAALVGPVFAQGPAAFARALAPAVAVIALHYLWVVHSDAQLEEAVAETERRKGESRRGRSVPVVRAAPFALGPVGRPETAVFWKNTIQAGRYVSVATLVRVVIPVVVLAIVVGLDRRAQSLAPVVAAMAGLVTIVGPYVFRHDLRMDMPHLRVLKTWPITGRELLVGELLAPAVLLSVLAWSLLAVALALSSSWTAAPADLLGRAAIAASGSLLAPALVTGQLIIQNAAVVLFPGWVATGAARARGIEAMGQNMLMFAGTLLALAVGVLPAAAVAGGIGFLLYGVVGWPGVMPAAVFFAGALLAEVWVALTWLGRVIERTEPSQVEIAD